MAMAGDADLEMGYPLLPRSANRVTIRCLELAMTGDLPQFQAEMVQINPLNLTAGPDVYENRTLLHMAALHGQAEVLKCIMSAPDMSVQVVNARDNFGYTPLHLAVRSKHESIVRALTTSSLTLPDRFVAATGERDELDHECDGFTPMHLAAAGGSPAEVKLLLQQSCQLGTTAHNRPVNIHATTWQGTIALDIAKKRNHPQLEDMLECFDVNWLQLERQKSSNSVNAIVVGAALVATLTLECLLQPPLGIPDQSLMADSKEKASAQAQIGWFFLCIALSFASSVVALVTGTVAIIRLEAHPSTDRCTSCGGLF